MKRFGQIEILNIVSNKGIFDVENLLIFSEIEFDWEDFLREIEHHY